MRSRMIVGLAVAVVFAAGMVVPVYADNEDFEKQMENVGTMRTFLGLMEDYLRLSKEWTEMLKDEDKVVFLVAEGIAEIHEKKGDKAKAVPDLRKLMKKYSSRPVAQRAIRFKIRDIYKDAGKYDEALKELKAIVGLDKK